MREAIGLIELTSVGIGYQVQDAMLKAANVALVLGRTICSGKYINLVTGSVAAVEASVDAGLKAAPDGVIDYMLIPNVDPSARYPEALAQIQNVEYGQTPRPQSKQANELCLVRSNLSSPISTEPLVGRQLTLWL